jgi:hypothetical protein
VSSGPGRSTARAHRSARGGSPRACRGTRPTRRWSSSRARRWGPPAQR